MAKRMTQENAILLARAWAYFYHDAMTADGAGIATSGPRLLKTQREVGVTLWDDDMIELKIRELTKAKEPVE